MDLFQVVRKNKALYSLAGKLLVGLSYLLNRIKLGSNGEFKFGEYFIPQNFYLSCKGEGNKVCFSDYVTIKNAHISINGNNNRLNISQKFKAYEAISILIEGDNCELSIGTGTTIGSALITLGESNTMIRIGPDCMISRNVCIDTSDFHSIIDLRSGGRVNRPSNVVIGNHVWIGYNARINKGASIGDNCVIAANSVVPGKEYNNNSLLAGMPARVIRDEITWSREKL